MERLLIRPAEAAQAFGLGRSKIYELIARGTIPSVRIGRSVRVPIQELKDWLDSQQIETSGEDFEGSLEKK